MEKYEREVEMEFLPILLGTDNNAYGVARSIHEAYGIKSLCIGKAHLSYTANSKIVRQIVHPKMDKDEIFLATLRQLADKHRKIDKILISCGDGYTKLLTKHKDVLAKDFLFNIIDADKQEALENKLDFYKMCEAYDLPYPKTLVIDQAMVEEGFENPLTYPIALKPNDSISYLNLKFEGKHKAYKIEKEKDLMETLKKIYQAGYQGQMIAQDFIPGDSSQMAVLNAYVNTKGQVTMMCFAQCLLDAVLPAEIGNYHALVTMDGQEVYQDYKDFLEAIDYRGFANFDLKKDPRDGIYKVFEINIRQGRSSYCMTAGGCNFITYLIEELLGNKEEACHYHKDSGLWLYVDPYVLKKYVPDSLRPLALEELKKGYSFTEWYKKDRSLKRWLSWMRHRLSSIKTYRIYKED